MWPCPRPLGGVRVALSKAVRGRSCSSVPGHPSKFNPSKFSPVSLGGVCVALSQAAMGRTCGLVPGC